MFRLFAEKLRKEIGLDKFDTLPRGNRTPEQQSEYAKLNQTFRERSKEVETKYPVTITDFVNHIDHAVKVAGIDHVGKGDIPIFYSLSEHLDSGGCQSGMSTFAGRLLVSSALGFFT